ncbi:hypothetical protein PIB30_077963 [Stylosanthes scabra]|uniref:Uncharacterized protein n=1 Tax=Stylosanthes scabra TaxID=79078 RepID=A0ABU6QRI4_9FABA|nr:hypothetical protein [Stylosanthes scabra]
MKEDERIEEALGRFSRIFNGLNILGKKYPEREIITKMTILDQNGENKKKSLALKASSQEEESDENSDSEEDQDFAILMKQFNKFAKKKNFNFKGKKKSPPKCFEYDSSTDSDEEEEVANLCLMANIEKASNENEDLKKTNVELQNENESLKVQNKTFEKAKAISNNESCKCWSKKNLNLDNRCSKHMMSDEESLTKYKPIDEGNIIYGESH